MKIKNWLHANACLAGVLISPLLGGQVINVGPPSGVDDYALLQDAIDANPGTVLVLEEGTYELGGNTLVIPHGLTLEGTLDTGGLQVTVLNGGADPVVHVNAFGAAAMDTIVIRNLNIRSAQTAIAHVPFDGSLVPGGGNLVVDACRIENQTKFGIRSWYAEDVDVVIRNSTLQSTGNDAIRIQFTGYNLLEVSGNVIDVRQSPEYDAHGLEILNEYVGTWMDWQDAEEGEAHISGNEILVGSQTDVYHGGFIGAGLIGETFFSGNTVRTAGFSNCILIDTADKAKLIKVENNAFIGADTDNGLYRIVMEIAERADLKGKGGAKVIVAHNTITGWWASGIDSYELFESGIGSYKNTFVNNDFSGASVAGYDPWGIPPVHYSFWPGAGTNSVTDSLGQELHYINLDEGNHVQGNSTFVNLWP